MRLNTSIPSRSFQLLAMLPFALAVNGCAPLQQSPLVYTSGVTVGVRVGVAPTQADAFETVIGFKMLDAAYVPVAVSKPDIEGPNSHKAPVHEIYGQFGEEITPEAVRQLNVGEMESVKAYLGASADLTNKTAALNKAEEDFRGAKSEAETAKKADDAATNNVKDNQATILGLSSLKVTGCDLNTADLGLTTKDWSKVNPQNLVTAVNSCAPTPDVGLADSIMATLKRAKNLLENQKTMLVLPEVPSPNTKNLVATQDAREIALNEAKDKVKQARVELGTREKSAMEALQKLANIRKRDALSVYGSFNGAFDQSVANKAPTIGSKLGKVFSTGVAAQNLTEAAKISAFAEAFSQCVASLKDLAALMHGERDGFIKQGLDKCDRGVKTAVAAK